MQLRLTNSFRALALFIVCGMLAGCRGTAAGVKPVDGTLDWAVGLAVPPQVVKDVLAQPTLDDRFEAVLGDRDSEVSVWSLVRCSEQVSCEGCGVVIVNGKTVTPLAQVRHGKMPSARYDAAKKELLLTGGDIEGTGVDVERLYLFNFDEDGKAHFTSIDPYDMQQALREHLGYSIKGNDITLAVDGKLLITVTNHVEDMGGFYEKPVWIGEQLAYDISGDQILVNVTPGISFNVGKVLIYDDMPTIIATVTMKDKGFKLSDFRIKNQE